MKKISIFIVLITFFVSINSQSQEVSRTQGLVTSSGQLSTFDRTDKSVVGSPYIQESFFPARVVADQEKVFNVRYNAISDEVEIKADDNTIQTVNKYLPGITVTFLMDNKTYVATTYFNEDGISVTGYLVQKSATGSNAQLFIKEKKIFLDEKPAQSGYDQAKPAKYERGNDVYYYTVNGEIAKVLPKNKKEIAALFPKHEKEVLNYIKSEKINVKKDDDLIKLFQYLNQLPL